MSDPSADDYHQDGAGWLAVFAVVLFSLLMLFGW